MMLDIIKLRAELAKRRDEPWLVAEMIKYNPELEQAGLASFAWLLADAEYGCHYNDVAGLIDCLETARANKPLDKPGDV